MERQHRHGVDLIFPTAIKAILKILAHHNVRACIIGELAYNYYNVPDVIHDVEFCVADEAVDDASVILTETGLVKTDPYADIHLYNEYKSKFPRLTTTSWLPDPITFVIFPASVCGLQPLETHAFRPGDYIKPDSEFSKEILEDLDAEDLRNMLFPRLAPFMTSLAKRYLEWGDDMAAAAVEHLVDGLDISDAWCTTQLHSVSPDVLEFVQERIRGKKSRIAYYQDNTVTCMIVDEEQAKRVSTIPGYD